jgi:hypothetical protein
MGISMVGYKMIYKNVIYNLISMMLCFTYDKESQSNTLTDIEVVYIDENNRVVMAKDKVEEFQFISK